MPGALLFWLACLAIVAIAATLQLAAMPRDMPFTYNGDEAANIRTIHDMILNRTANPGRFNYPSFFYYLHVPGQLVLQALTGTLEPPIGQSMGNGFAPQPLAFVVARVTTLCMGLGVVVCVMLLVREITDSRWPIMLAGMLAAINPFIVARSPVMTPDVPAALFTTLALMGAVRVVRRASISDYAFGALMTGLAAASKYNAGLVGIAIAVGHVLRHGNSTTHLQRLIVCGAASIAVFILASPFVVLDFRNASSGILSEINHYRTGHAGNEGDTLNVNLAWLWAMFGASLLLVFLAPFHSAQKRILPVAVFSIAYFALLSVQFVRFERNLWPLVPALIALVGMGFEVVRQRLYWWIARPYLPAALAAVFACVVLAPGLIATISSLTSMRSPDVREQARLWIAEHVAPGSSILADSYAPYSDPKIYRVSGQVFSVRAPTSTIEASDIVVVTKQGSGRFLDGPPSAERETFQRINQLACERNEFKNAAAITEIWVFRLRCQRH